MKLTQQSTTNWGGLKQHKFILSSSGAQKCKPKVVDRTGSFWRNLSQGLSPGSFWPPATLDLPQLAALQPLPLSLRGPSLCMALCLSVFCLIKTLSLDSGPILIQYNLISRSLITSAKTFIPNKVTFTGLGIWKFLWGGSTTPPITLGKGTSYDQGAWTGPGHTGLETAACQGSAIGHWSSGPTKEAPRQKWGVASENLVSVKP